jgi:hypothetical protein
MKSFFVKIAIFIVGFIMGVIATECFGQTIKDNSVFIKDNKVNYELPMAYELMHIAMALTDTTIVSNGYNVHAEIIDTKSAYYREVIQHFELHKNHELIKKLNKAFAKSANYYLYNLLLAYNCSYANGTIRKNFQFPFFHRLMYSFTSVNRKVLDDFARVSNFEQFYAQHRDYYKGILSDVQQHANVNEQQLWLEKQFPNRYDQYTIVISPLMYGTHFTRRINKKNNNRCIMWVASYEENKALTPAVNAGRYTGIVMTEIDHNYVNPVSDQHKKELNKIMGEPHRNKWTAGSYSDSYKSGYKIFNEYMTHAVYLLYTNEKLSASEQLEVEKAKINSMVNIRKFIKFDAFYQQLKQRYQSKKANETLADLYPQIMEWCKNENEK